MPTYRQFTATASTPVQIFVLSKDDIYHRLPRVVRESSQALSHETRDEIMFVDRTYKTDKWRAYKENVERRFARGQERGEMRLTTLSVFSVWSTKVMSPNDSSNDTAQSPPITGHERTVTPPAEVVDPPTHERGADVNERILKILMGLEGRMERMEASQLQMDENERLRGEIESGLFSSLLGRNMGNAGPMHLDAL
ncbi:hypothetical protein ABG067_007391, partial [Albugo candida]